VCVDLDGVPHLVGRLWARARKNKESATFEYDKTWLENPARFSLEQPCRSALARFTRRQTRLCSAPSATPRPTVGGGRSCAAGNGGVRSAKAGRRARSRKKALKLAKIRPFEVYSIRHTFLTRLGESGCDAWTLARIAGHSNISISQRYVHPSEDAVLNALSRLGGHNSGHSVENATLAQPGELPPNTDNHEG
jgi:hypothetical protein